MKLTFDKYSNKYYMVSEKSGAVVATFTLDELEALSTLIGQHLTDAYCSELDFFGDEGDCDGCKI